MTKRPSRKRWRNRKSSTPARSSPSSSIKCASDRTRWCCGKWWSIPGSVTIVPILPDGQVVMIRQYRHAARKTLWELPAGTLEPNEEPEASARRELVEEVGYEAGQWHFLFSAFLTPGYDSELAYLYLATDLKPVGERPESDERIAAVPVPFEEAVAMVERGEVQNANTVMGLLAAWRRRDRCEREARGNQGRILEGVRWES